MQSADPAAHHRDTIIAVRDVSFSYNGLEVLKNIHLDIHRGDYLGLVGGNGSGKTTLLKVILGLLTPRSGSVTLFGQPLHTFKNWGKIGYVPQHAVNFDSNFPASVEEVVRMGRYGRRGLFRPITDTDKEKALKALEHVNMQNYRERHIGELSGGEKQRVFIARALSGEPEILFLDEPTVGVERAVQEQFYALLRKLNRELRLTIVLVTHDIEAMTREASHIACLDQTLFFHGSIDAYFKSSHQVVHPHS